MTVKTPKGFPATEDMVANILSYYRSATQEQLQAGRGWYPAAESLAHVISRATGTDLRRVVLAIAALSPRNPWRWNVFDAYAFAEARAEGRTMPRATTFHRNSAAAWRALDPATETPWLTTAPKVKAFVSAILGDGESVVVDTWAVRVATAFVKSRVATDAEYAYVAHAYNVAANLVHHEWPRDLQAITWLVARTEGTALIRPSNADTFKAGTPEFLREALLAS